MHNAETQQLSGSQQIAELGHLRQNAAAWLIGISARRLRDHAAPRNSDGTYNASELIKWRVSQVEKSAQEKLALDRELAGEDPELFAGGGNSPWLEQCRKEKARELRRKNEVAEGSLVETATMETQLAEIAQVFRNRAEALERLHGPKVGQDIRDMVDEAQAAWKRNMPVVVAKEPQVEKQLALESEKPPAPPAKKKPKKKLKPKKERKKRRRARAVDKPKKVPPASASRPRKVKKKKPRAGAVEQLEPLQQSRPAGYRKKKRGSGYRIGR